jgi:hypothetical protein
MQVAVFVWYWVKFFDILEEVIKEKTTVETLFGFGP